MFTLTPPHLLGLLLVCISSLCSSQILDPNQNILNYYKSAEGSFLNSAAQVSITNLTTIVGKTVYLNCTLGSLINTHNQEDNAFFSKLNPTWLKADPLYNQQGVVTGFKTENIIVTRKGIIADNYKHKLKLINSEQNSKLLVLKINDVEPRDEGKYICREFNSQVDKLFYLNVYCKFFFFYIN
jgi:hypothetical protein